MARSGRRRLLAALLAALVALQTAPAARAAYDCSLGCPLYGDAGECGADGLTYINECLAICGGTAVAYRGPCLPPGGSLPQQPSVAPVVGRGDGGDGADEQLAAHPIGRFFARPPPEAAAAAAAAAGERAAAAGFGADPFGIGDASRNASAADISRYRAQGFALVGPAAMGSWGMAKPASDPSGLGDPGVPSDRPGRLQLYVVRVFLKAELVYVRRTPLVGDAPGVPAEPPARQGRAGRAAAAAAPFARPAAAPFDSTGGSLGEEEEDDAGKEGEAEDVPESGQLRGNSGNSSDSSGSGAGGGARRPRLLRRRGRALAVANPIRAADWRELRRLYLGLPYSAVGALYVQSDLAAKWRCSASLVGNATAITAAHCVYNRITGASLKSANFAAHLYFGASRKASILVSPYGDAESVAYDFLSGFKTIEDANYALLQDVAIVRLARDVGADAAVLNLEYRPQGYAGRIYTAGYPGQTPIPDGRYYRLAAACRLSDADGNDGRLAFRWDPPLDRCFTRCAIAEAGQSGQPAYVKEYVGSTAPPRRGIYKGYKYTVLGVLSYGPETGTCGGHDVYAQIGELAMTWLREYAA
ncbi:hypothetical protein Rsub_08686 [Raphidocelis subcapitata]|uniref:Kazal-like domain-containing protein n=1 Tax=Raphidocelis subcapitata TaxID=307507 RepID=A0A2V0P755_9CHLO|nr:hypothetical protein Rsub_08686 [Raphidocelis subcapitata]|eukprot:GBF95704.1 hypothetical protein Rsub_08686 [Raphidocelis subcapitata]